MTRIAVISDTHDHVPPGLVGRLTEADEIWHLGDVCEPDVLAEFDYELNPSPSIPVIDTTKDRRDMWLLKRYGLPAMYWHGMVKGRV